MRQAGGHGRRVPQAQDSLQAVAADVQDYKHVGKLAGRFYDASGQPSAELQRMESAAARAAAGEAASAAKAAAGGPPVDGDPCQLRRDANGGALARA